MNDMHNIRSGLLENDVGYYVKLHTQRAEWHVRKAEGEQVAALLYPLPTGTEFTLDLGAGRAYAGTYRKNHEGTWDQVRAPASPLVTRVDAAHLGFCVGLHVIDQATATFSNDLWCVVCERVHDRAIRCEQVR